MAHVSFIVTRGRFLRSFYPLINVELQQVACPNGKSHRREAIKQIAPQGGSGVKRYVYSSGGVREQVFWSKYEVDKIEYYDRNGVLLYRALPKGRHALLMSVGDDGKYL